MGEGVTIDARMQAALARLTDNEKECLRRRLRQQTAKEMALDLGVSPHAVEKRLKMARTKLGLSSSLEAARLLAASEEYQRTGPQASDLAPAPSRDKRRVSPLALGAVSMIILAAVVIAVTAQAPEPGGVAPLGTGGVAALPSSAEAAALPPGHVAPSEAEIVLMTQTTFRHVDADDSDYIDGLESPIGVPSGPQPVYRRDENGNIVPTGERVVQDADEVRAQFYLRADQNGDGRISYPEFHRWSAPNLVRRGIPAAWQADMRSWMSPED